MFPKDLHEKLLDFRAKRDWQQFHSPRNLAISISLEAAELLEHFQWCGSDSQEAAKRNLEAIAFEAADIAMYLHYLCSDLGIDLEAAIRQKVALNEAKYPVEKARGRATKYTQLDDPR